jgi:hypothetical protein
MIAEPSTFAPQPSRWIGWLVFNLAASVALISALPYAGSWHDGSRLAMVEALVDYHTWAIEGSIFVNVPEAAGKSPYNSESPVLQYGTKDKLFIDGHYYSDKPVAALLLAGVYQLWQWCGGDTARERPDRFCLLMVLAGAGLPYVISVCCIYRLTGVLRLSLALRLALTASFALATVALPYARQVNVHIMMLAVLAGMVLGIARLGEATQSGRTPWLRLAGLGFLAGLGYTLDVGAGAPLVLGLLILVAYRCRRVGPVLATALAALPWIAVHQAINYAIGGTFKPINSVPEFSTWPGCPFGPEDLTGTWKHSLDSFLLYAAAMMLGKRGFLLHNLPLLLALPATLMLLRRPRGRAEIVYLGSWCVATWLMYAGVSNNSSGVCCSVRWFVPFLAPAYYALAVALRDRPPYRAPFLILSAWGLLFAGIMWHTGPWTGRMVPLYWPTIAAALLSCWGYSRWAQRKHTANASDVSVVFTRVKLWLAPAAPGSAPVMQHEVLDEQSPHT